MISTLSFPDLSTKRRGRGDPSQGHAGDPDASGGMGGLAQRHPCRGAAAAPAGRRADTRRGGALSSMDGRADIVDGLAPWRPPPGGSRLFLAAEPAFAPGFADPGRCVGVHFIMREGRSHLERVSKAVRF